MADRSYTVRRSDRARRARLTVTRDGEAVVVLPRRAPDSLARELVTTHGAWLDRQLTRVRERSARLDRRLPLGAGRVLAVGGVDYRVVVTRRPAASASAAASKAGPGRATVSLSPALWPAEPGILELRLPADGDAVAALDAWLRREARRVLTRRVAELSPVVGVPLPAVTIRAQVSRWGSASRTGRVSLNWRLILAPASVLDYVVIHELAHLRVPGHSRRFWALGDRHVPDSRAARRWLREHHADLMAALD